jgi:glutathione S-transferase
MDGMRTDRLCEIAVKRRPEAMKLYRFAYSPYVLKVQALLDLMGRKYTPVDVPYGDRTELATLTGGYVYVPVLVDDGGQVVFDSRRICQHLLTGEAAATFVPPPLDGPIWAYHDWCDGPLEDVIFRFCSPAIRDKKSPGERALYVLIKERKFGPGCVDAWERDTDQLVARGNELLGPSARTLAAQPFLFGQRPVLADCALYGLFAFMRVADPALVERFPPVFTAWMRRLEELAAARR